MMAWLQNGLTHDGWGRALLVLIDSGAKGAVLLALAAGATLALRRGSAAGRHLAWALALGGLLLLPVLSAVVPKWQLPILPLAAAPGETSAAVRPGAMPIVEEPSLPAAAEPAIEPAARTANAVAAPVAAPTVEAAAPAGLPVAFWVVAGWLAAALAMLAPLAAGLVMVARLARRARPLAGAGWPELMRALRAALSVRRDVALLCGGREAMPMATGLLRPAIVLPEAAEGWSEEKRRAVLLHELAHVKRRDCLIHALARLAAALHWFNPLAWLALRRLRIERERACDDLVLAAGERASEYAGHLLEIARTMRTGGLVSAAAITMARKSQLEGRLLAILDATSRRRALTRRMLVAGMFAAMLVVTTLAAVQLGSRGPGATQNSKQEITTSTLTFAGGVKVNLLAVMTHPRQGDECWAPDGTPLSKVPAGFEKADGSVTPSKNEIAREFYMSVERPPNVGWVDATCDITSAGTTGGGTFGDAGKILIHQQAALPAGLKETSIKIGIAAGPWETLLRSTPGGGGGENFTRKGQPHSIVFSKALQDGGDVVVTVSDDLSSGEKHEVASTVIIAIDKAGKEHQPNGRASTMGRFSQQTCKYANLKVEQVERFEFRVRDYEWREIKGIRLEPSQGVKKSAGASNAGNPAKTPRTFDYTFSYERHTYGKSAQEAARDTQGLPDEATKDDVKKKIMRDQILKQRQRARTDGTGVRYEVLEDLGSPTDPQDAQAAAKAKQGRTSVYLYDGKAMADINRFENTAVIMPTKFAYPNLAFLMSSPAHAAPYTSIELKDVRPIKGYLVPFQIVMRSPQMEEKITIEKVDLDVSFEDGLFDLFQAIPPGMNVADTREKPMKEYKMPGETKRLDSRSSGSQHNVGVRRPDSTQQSNAKNLSSTITLQFRWVAKDAEHARAEQLPWYKKDEHNGREPDLWVLKEVLLSEKDVAAVEVQSSSMASNNISLKFKDEARERFARITGEGVGRRLAIVMRGKVLVAPVVKEKISGGSVMITGNFGREEAEVLAWMIKAGPRAGNADGKTSASQIAIMFQKLAHSEDVYHQVSPLASLIKMAGGGGSAAELVLNRGRALVQDGAQSAFARAQTWILLGAVRDANAVSLYSRLIANEPVEAVRSAAALAMGEFPSLEARQALEAARGRERSSAVREAIADAVAGKYRGRLGEVLTTEAQTAFHQSGNKSNTTAPNPRVDPAKAYEQEAAQAVEVMSAYLKQYPLSPYSVITMSDMAWGGYARLKRFDAAKQVLGEAIRLTTPDRFVNILEINLAKVELDAGELDAAEARLKRVMALPPPASFADPYGYTPQLFIAPEFLAKVFRARGQEDKAVAMMDGIADTAERMAREHPDQAPVISSYASVTYQDRIDRLLKKEPGNKKGAQALADEFQKRFPAADSFYLGNMMMNIWDSLNPQIPTAQE